MEKDIVERLRAAEVEYDPEGVWEEERLNALFQEAAAEIERLRSTTGQSTAPNHSHTRTCPLCCGTGYEIIASGTPPR